MTARSGLRSALTPPATMRSASMSRPESVSSRMASVGSSTAIWKISLRFFSPPENPSLTGRFSSDASMSSSLAFWRTSVMNSIASRSARPLCFRTALSAALRK